MIKSKSIIIALIFVVIVLISLLYNRKSNQKLLQKTFFSMDTIVTIETKNQVDMDNIQSKIEELNNIFDRHSNGTDLNNLNVNKSVESGTIKDLIVETSKLNDMYGYDLNITSGNLVDTWNISENPTIPTNDEISKALKSISMDNVVLQDDNIKLLNNTTLDVGSVAKGYTLDIVQSILQNTNATNTYVSMGSSTLMYQVENFPIYVRSPNSTEDVVCKFFTNDTLYISTSGGYERYVEIDGIKYPHILDLNTGYPVVTDLTSVTICADSGIKSDFLSTYVFMGGTENLSKYLNDDTISLIAIDNKNNIYVSNNLDVQVLDNSFKVVK